jgi:competence protein ComEC
LGFAAALLWCWGYDALRLSPALAAEGKYQRLEAELSDYPVRTDYGFRADGWAIVEGRRIKTRFYLYGELPELEPGDRIAGSFTLRRADRTKAGETRLDLQAKGILLTGSGRVEATAAGGSPPRYLPARLSRRISLRLAELIPADAAGLPRAMLTGDRGGLTEADRNDLSAAGASHVLAVSGLHVSMLVAVLWLLAGRGRLSSLLGIPLLGLYVLMTGASPSVARAALMLVPLLLAPIVGEENDPPSSLALAGLVLLLENPWAVANLSFQLSFAAVAGLLLVTPLLLDYFDSLPLLRRLPRWSGLKRLPDRLRDFLLRLLRRLVRGFFVSISASLGALIFTVPISAAVFGSLPVYGVLTNLLVLFPAALCLCGSLLVLGLGLIWTELGALAGGLLALAARFFFLVCRTVARLPGSLLYVDAYGLSFLIFAFFLILLALSLREKRLGLPLLSLLAALAVAVGFQRWEAASAGFTLAALDVGQGQCVCARTDSFTAVIDCGGSGGETAGSDAAAWLREKGADRIDALILTHYDRDHVSGAATLLSLMPVEAVYLPDAEADPENRAEIEAAALTSGAALCYVTENRTLPFSGGQLRLFAPVSDRTDNAACVCVLYSVGEYDMLVTGDLDAGAEYALLEREVLPPVELYVAGHHGSKGSSTQALLETLRPCTVFVSVGRNNYGLPSPEALDRFAACGAQVYRTDECGDLELSVH